MSSIHICCTATYDTVGPGDTSLKNNLSSHRYAGHAEDSRIQESIDNIDRPRFSPSMASSGHSISQWCPSSTIQSRSCSPISTISGTGHPKQRSRLRDTSSCSPSTSTTSSAKSQWMQSPQRDSSCRKWRSCPQRPTTTSSEPDSERHSDQQELLHRPAFLLLPSVSFNVNGPRLDFEGHFACPMSNQGVKNVHEFKNSHLFFFTGRVTTCRFTGIDRATCALRRSLSVSTDSFFLRSRPLHSRP